MKPLPLMCLVGIAIVLVSCGGEYNSTSGETNRLAVEEYTFQYEFCSNCTEGSWPNTKCAQICPYYGCTTGKKKANSFQEYCNLLKNDAENNHCARADRNAAFHNAGCPGTF